MMRRARIYVCGITPYDTTHIGHAATFVWVDVLARVLEHVGIEPEVVRNITDVDDELLREAAARETSWQALATQQTFQFEDDMRKLRVQRPAFEPVSRDYVTDVIFLARALLDRGVAYERAGSVYFRAGDLTELSGLTRDAALAGLRPARRPGRRPGQGRSLRRRHLAGLRPPESRRGSRRGAGAGRAGTPSAPPWRPRCSGCRSTSTPAVPTSPTRTTPTRTPSSKRPPGCSPFARSWMHVGTVTKGGEKVAKSTGNLVFVMDLLQRGPRRRSASTCSTGRWDQTWDFVRGRPGRCRAPSSSSCGRRPGPRADRTPRCGAAVTPCSTTSTCRGPSSIAIDEGGEAARTVAKVLALL